jgi:hypothetical protein
MARLRPSLSSRSYNRTVKKTPLCAPFTAMLVALLLAGHASAAPPATPAGGEYDPVLTRLFTPGDAPAGAYEVWRSDESIEMMAERLRNLDPAPLADAWKVQRGEPGTVFTEGSYDRGRLARLYVGQRLSVARGALATPAGVVAFTLVSPWPDAMLRALQPGTLVIVVRVAVLLEGSRTMKEAGPGPRP